VTPGTQTPRTQAPRVLTTSRVAQHWRAYWDPESEVLILTLTSAILAGIGLALILMGALPASAPAPAVDNTVVADQTGAADNPVAAGAVPRPPAAVPTHRKTVRKAGTLGPSVPRALDIPSIGVHTPLMSLGLQADGTVQVPPLKGDAPAGWYKGLSSPGEAGPAVILGHVDSAKDGPAVFYRLKELRPGARVSIDRADGRRVHFVVKSVVRYPKQNFPTAAVYGPRPGAELRLVTCGGSFDALRRRYRDNIVVYATMTGTSRIPKPVGQRIAGD